MPRVYSELNNKPLQLYSLKYLGIQLTRHEGNVAKGQSVNCLRGEDFYGQTIQRKLAIIHKVLLGVNVNLEKAKAKI